MLPKLKVFGILRAIKFKCRVWAKGGEGGVEVKEEFVELERM